MPEPRITIEANDLDAIRGVIGINIESVETAVLLAELREQLVSQEPPLVVKVIRFDEPSTGSKRKPRKK